MYNQHGKRASICSIERERRKLGEYFSVSEALNERREIAIQVNPTEEVING